MNSFRSHSFRKVNAEFVSVHTHSTYYMLSMLCATQYTEYIEILLFITAANTTTSTGSYYSFLFTVHAALLCSAPSTPANTIVTNHLQSDHVPGAGILSTNSFISHIGCRFCRGSQGLFGGWCSRAWWGMGMKGL